MGGGAFIKSFAGVCMLAMASAALAGAPPARPDLPVEGVVTDPNWVSQPNGDDLSRFYPQLAAFLGMSGETLISCQVSSLGMLDHCNVQSETPVGFGFGDASLQMTSLFRMQPQALDGAPVGGARVNIPLHFRLPKPDAPAETEDNGQPPSAAALALGRRLAAATFVADRSRSVEAGIEQWKVRFGAASREEQLAFDAIEKAVLDSVPELTERTAKFYAIHLTVPQLTEIVGFFESPAGTAWTAQNAQWTTEISSHGLDMHRVPADALAQVCRQIACLPEDTPAAKGK